MEKAAKYRAEGGAALLVKNLNAKYYHRYGFDAAEKQARIERQNGQCAICRTTEPGGTGKWHTDHNHETRQVRDELCHSCNTSLGHLKENKDTLRAMIEYLTRWESKNV